MEALDSALFQLPELVDYRASFDGQLNIAARTLDAGLEEQIFHEAKSRYPDLQITVCASAHQLSDCPMYAGKRYIIQKTIV